MLLNHLKLAYRHIVKHKAFSMINIIGLTIGLAGILFVGSYIYGELNVNAGIPNKSRIYMIQSKWKDPDMGYDFTTLAPLSKALQDNYPHLVVDQYHHDGITSIVSNGDKKFSEGLQVGDSSFLTMFGFKLLHGNPATALNSPNSLALTEEMAIKYFGRTDVVGETLAIQSFSGGKQDFVIHAVLKESPFNTVTHWGNGINNGENQFFLPAASLRFFGRDAAFESWQNAFIISYVELKAGVNPGMLKEPVRQLLKTNASPEVQRNLDIVFTPLDQYYLKSNNGMAYRMIYALGFAAFFILVMAIINFVNITIGNSFHRIREIGVRKVMGSTKSQLRALFLTEAVLMSVTAMAAALIIYVVGRNMMNDLLGKQLYAIPDFPPVFVLVPLGLVLLVGLMAGIYPAFFLSNQASVSSLKGKLDTVNEKVLIRKGMMALQFTVAIVVFTGAVIIYSQVNYFFSKDLGYQKESVITARVPRDWTPQGVQKMELIRNQISALPEVADASFSFEIPDGASANKNNILFKPEQDSTQGIIAESMFTDERYRSTYGITLLAGEFFNEKGGLVENAEIVLNNAAIKALGWREAKDAIGQRIRIQGSQNPFTIGGVVNDFHFGPLQDQIPPLFFDHVQNAPLFRYLSIRLKTGSASKAIQAVNAKWSALMPDSPFEYRFLDETLSRLYHLEIRMKKASLLATVISLIIVLLGVSGIVAQSISRRVKEVGIRKVLGATRSQIITLFAKDFLITIVIANLLAWPLAYYFLENWLKNYAYRINITPLPFMVVTFIIIALVSLLISFKAGRIAVENPVKSLRTD